MTEERYSKITLGSRKVHKPAKKYSGFYGWQEYGYNVLDQKAKAYGVLMKEN